MPTYVSLVSWTEQGIKNYKDTISRAEDFTKLVEGSGGRVREVLYTVGEYDIVTVADFPHDETGTAVLLQVGLSVTSARTRCGPSAAARWPTSSGGPASAVTPHPRFRHWVMGETLRPLDAASGALSAELRRPAGTGRPAPSRDAVRQADVSAGCPAAS